MITYEYKLYGNPEQYVKIDDAIRTTKFIRNKAIHYWMDNKDLKLREFDLTNLYKPLANEFYFVKKLNSQARQAAIERAWKSIYRFYGNCKKKVKGPKGYPKFQKDCNSVEYSCQSGWKLFSDNKKIKFTDKNNIGSLKLMGSRDLTGLEDKIKRVRILKRSDGYYCQFVIAIERSEPKCTTGAKIGLDVGLEHFYTDSNGVTEDNPRFLRKAERKIKRLQRRLSKKVKGSNNFIKSKHELGIKHLKIKRQRSDHATKLARNIVISNDLIAIEDLKIKNMVKNHKLAKSISDASWYQFRIKLDYYCKVFKKVLVAVNPAYTSQTCSKCGHIDKASRKSQDKFECLKCGFKCNADHNAAINILAKAELLLRHDGPSPKDLTS